MKTTHITSSTTISTGRTTSTPLRSISNSATPHLRREESMVRVSWYYEEGGEIDQNERQSSVSMRARLLSTDSMNKSMIRTIYIRDGDTITSEIEKY